MFMQMCCVLIVKEVVRTEAFSANYSLYCYTGQYVTVPVGD